MKSERCGNCLTCDVDTTADGKFLYGSALEPSGSEPKARQQNPKRKKKKRKKQKTQRKTRNVESNQFHLEPFVSLSLSLRTRLGLLFPSFGLGTW